MATALLAGAAVAVYVQRSFPALDGRLHASGLAQAVQVRRDAADVTHIEAATPFDAWYALGYVHAQDRTWQLEFNRRLMHGELSELFGPAALDTDRLHAHAGHRGCGPPPVRGPAAFRARGPAGLQPRHQRLPPAPNAGAAA